MKIINVTQGSGEWLRARAGVITASEFDSLMTPLWKKREGEMPQNYILRKIAERCMGLPLSDASGWALEQGAILESEAIPWLEFTYNLSVQRVGFITTDDSLIGCSPDGLLGEDGGLEIKCPQPVAHLKYLLAGGLPREHVAQVHGSMYVTGRRWWKFVSYSRQFPPVVVTVERDEAIIAKIDAVIGEALAELEAKYETVRALKAAHDAPLIDAGRERLAIEEAAARAAIGGGELPGEKWLRQHGSGRSAA